MCVFNFASSSVVAGLRPRPPLPLCEELRGEVCLWEQKRTRDVLLRGPPPPPKQPCLRLCRPGRRPGQPHMLRGPSPKPAALSPATGGLRCWRRGLGWLSVPGQLFARILDINPSGSFCNWCFYVTSNVPSVSQNAASLVPVLWGGLLHPPPQSPESISYSWLMSLGSCSEPPRAGYPGAVGGAWSSGRSLGWESGDLVYIPVPHPLSETLGKAWGFCEPHFPLPSTRTPHLSPWRNMGGNENRCFINCKC